MHVTVCICTRDRGSGIQATLTSLRAQQHTNFDVIIVDQSMDDGTAVIVEHAVAEDSRISYYRSATAGKYIALNMAISLACGPLVACTDDDCVAAPDWLSILVRHFAANPDVGLVAGPVIASPYARARGIVPEANIASYLRINSPWRFWQDHGIGANQTFRLMALRKVGPFDEHLGVGAVFRSCADFDITYRVLRSGYSVLNVPDALVSHDGFRPISQALQHRRNVAFGMGGMFLKHLRLGDRLSFLPS